jgi:hypothetical protein
METNQVQAMQYQTASNQALSQAHQYEQQAALIEMGWKNRWE